MANLKLWIGLGLIILVGLAAVFVVCKYWDPSRKVRYEEVFDPDELASELNEAPAPVKRPAFAPELTQLIEDSDGQRYWLNASQAVIGLDMAELRPDDLKLCRKLFPDFAEALAALGQREALFSLDQVTGYSKYTDDRLYAGLELANHRGSAIYPGGKQGLLRDLLAAVQAQPASEARTAAGACLAAALTLGGDKPKLDRDTRSKVQRALKRFKGQQYFAKPTGLYTQSAELKCIFQRDRWLQQPYFAASELEACIVLARAVKSDAVLLAAYTKYLRLMEVMTNPVSNMNLLDLLPYEDLWDDPLALWAALEKSPAMERCAQRGNDNPATVGVAFWPFSTSKENQLFARIYTSDVLPPGSTMEDFITAIRSGDVDLAPVADSGWYDYQIFALEPLLLPERALETDKLRLKRRYQQRLANAFKSIITQRRETHLKQEAITLCPEAESAGFPAEHELAALVLTLEPAATNYLRTARCYTMLAAALARIYGAEQYQQLTLADGTRLAAELDQARWICYGNYLLACHDLKLPLSLEQADLAVLAAKPADGWPAVDAALLNRYPILRTGGLTEPQQQAALAVLMEAQQFIDSYALEPCAQYDARVIVPVLSDAARREWRYWVVAGVKFERVCFWYESEPRAIPVSDAASGDEVSLADANARFASGDAHGRMYDGNSALIPNYVFTEITLGAEPPTREELRAICDKCETLEEITKALKKKFK